MGTCAALSDSAAKAEFKKHSKAKINVKAVFGLNTVIPFYLLSALAGVFSTYAKLIGFVR